MLRDENSHYLEKVIARAIQKGHGQNALHLIKVLQKDREAEGSFSYQDSDGKNLIYLATEQRLRDVAEKLYDILKNSNNVLFSETDTEDNLVSITAASGYYNILADLLAKAKAAAPDAPYRKIYLKANNQGNTPLHAACASIHSTPNIIALLIDAIADEENKLDLINEVTLAGETPLHLALKPPIAGNLNGAVDLLIKNGADLTVVNNAGKSPLSLLIDAEESMLQKDFPPVFASLSPPSQAIVLKAYKHYLAEHQDEKAQKIYLRCAQVYSLAYFLKAEMKLAKPKGKKEKDKNPTKLLRYQQLNHDRQILNALLSDIYQEVKCIRALSQASGFSRFLNKFLPFVATGVTLGFEAWLLYEALSCEPQAYFTYGRNRVPGPQYVDYECRASSFDNTYYLFDANNQTNFGVCQKRFDTSSCTSWFGETIMAGILGGAAVTVVGLGSKFSWFECQPVVTSKDDLLNAIEIQLLNKLKLLSVNDNPTTVEVRDELAEKLQDYHGRFPKTAAHDLLVQIHNIIIEIRVAMNRSHRPFSLFTQPVLPKPTADELIVDIDELEESSSEVNVTLKDDEVISLSSKHVPLSPGHEVINIDVAANINNEEDYEIMDKDTAPLLPRAPRR